MGSALSSTAPLQWEIFGEHAFRKTMNKHAVVTSAVPPPPEHQACHHIHTYLHFHRAEGSASSIPTARRLESNLALPKHGIIAWLGN